MRCVSHITPIAFKQKGIQNYIYQFQILQNHEIAQSRADITENFQFLIIHLTGKVIPSKYACLHIRVVHKLQIYGEIMYFIC